MFFQSACFPFILITLIGIVKSDKRISLCEGIGGKRVTYIMVPPTENANITFRYGFKNDDDTKKMSVIKLHYDFGTECLFYLLLNQTHADWLVKHHDTLLDFTGFLMPNQTQINHNHISQLCKLTRKNYNFTFGTNGEQDTNAVCNSFLSFDFAFTLVSTLTGEEVPDENNKGKKRDEHKGDEVNENMNDGGDKWALVVVIPSSAFVVIGFAVFLVKYYNGSPFIRELV